MSNNKPTYDQLLAAVNHLSRQQIPQGNGANGLSGSVQNALVPQLGQMLQLENGPRSKKLRSMDEISSLRQRNYQIQTAGGDRIDMQETYVWFGEDVG